MASLNCIGAELVKAFLLFRQPKPKDEEFMLLAQSWGDVFFEVSDAGFREGMRLALAETRFFPVPADVMLQVKELHRRSVAAKAKEAQALPEYTALTDEQLEENRRVAEKWKGKIAQLRHKWDASTSRGKDESLDAQLTRLASMEAMQ